MARNIETVVDGIVVKFKVKKWKITLFSLREEIIESDLELTDLYQKFESAMTIEEV